MECCKTLGLENKVDSPLSAFNNILVQIGNELNNVYGIDVFATNNCLFLDSSMLLFNCIKILKVDDKICLKFSGYVSEKNIKYIRITLDKFRTLKTIFNKYLFIMNDVRKNYDDSVSVEYINSIIDDIYNDPNVHRKIYLVPLKNKIFENYDKTFDKPVLDKTLEIVLLRYSYIITFVNNGPVYVKYSLIRVLSSDLSESNSIENLRFLEKEVIKSGMLKKDDDLHTFLVKLLIYGEF